MTLDELEKELRELSDADFNILGRRLGLVNPDKLSYAKVQIDEGDETDTPFAVVEYADGSKEKIDIFATIRGCARSVGHPVILLAIRHWQEILRHRSALMFKDEWENIEGVDENSRKGAREIREHYFSGLPDRASKNLTRISEAIIQGAKDNSVAKEDAFAARVEDMGYAEENTWLYEAFDCLRNDKTRNPDLRLVNLTKALQKRRVVNHIIPLGKVMTFLRTENGKFYLRPRRWDAMRNAFLAWCFHLDHNTVVKYFSKAKKRNTKSSIDKRYLFPRIIIYELREAGDRRIYPVVHYENASEVDNQTFCPSL